MYCNVHVHSMVAEVEATARREKIQLFVEDQVKLGEEGLDKRDHYILEVTLGDLETTSG